MLSFSVFTKRKIISVYRLAYFNGIPFLHILYSGIHVTVSGYAKIRWIKKGYPRDSERAMCRAYRSYLSSRSYVLGSCNGTSCIDWLAGEYSYTFHVILPDNLPTSFDGKYGQIHYEIITTIERSGRYPKVFKLPFTVIQPLDLNADAIYRVSLAGFNGISIVIKTWNIFAGAAGDTRSQALLELLLPNWTADGEVFDTVLRLCAWPKDSLCALHKQ